MISDSSSIFAAGHRGMVGAAVVLQAYAIAKIAGLKLCQFYRRHQNSASASRNSWTILSDIEVVSLQFSVVSEMPAN